MWIASLRLHWRNPILPLSAPRHHVVAPELCDIRAFCSGVSPTPAFLHAPSLVHPWHVCSPSCDCFGLHSHQFLPYFEPCHRGKCRPRCDTCILCPSLHRLHHLQLPSEPQPAGSTATALSPVSACPLFYWRIVDKHTSTTAPRLGISINYLSIRHHRECIRYRWLPDPGRHRHCYLALSPF